MRESFDLTSKSKRLSYLLRHNPGAANLTLDANGWASVDELLFATGFTREELDYIVTNNDKKRFTYNADHSKIRAAQGHSIEVDLAYTAQTPPNVLFHGTAVRFIRQILQEGLKPINRTHVHLSVDPETAVSVGKRHGKPVVLLIDAAQMNFCGYKFYMADNGVWLTDNVPPGYITQPE